MIKCPKCGGTACVKASYPIPNGQVRRLLCTGCNQMLYTTELIQESGAFYNEVHRRYDKALRHKRASERATRVKERSVHEQGTPEKLPNY